MPLLPPDCDQRARSEFVNGRRVPRASLGVLFLAVVGALSIVGFLGLMIFRSIGLPL
ncbi:hypothetical protein [Sulfitobacter pontiacus]|uniref:hypothetical protein n=1 Tax=Sulfitobacter pontiacus TaxID=60137 RepID=UPI003F5CC70D